MQLKLNSNHRKIALFLATGFSCCLFLLNLGEASSGFNEDDHIKVMSFNIRYGSADDGPNSWPQRSKILFQVLEQQGPDIVGVQEALKFQLDEILDQFPYFLISGRARDDGKEKGEYSSILFRRDRFQLLEEETFWLSDTPDVPGSKSWGNSITRICSRVKLKDLTSGNDFMVLNLHLDHRSQNSREKSVEFVLKRHRGEIGQIPMIVMGDFNAGEDNPAIQKIYQCRSDSKGSPGSSKCFVDSFRVLYPTAEQTGTFNGWKGTKDGPKIDYVFVSEHFKVRNAGIVDYNEDSRYPSDHFPVTATLELVNGSRSQEE